MPQRKFGQAAVRRHHAVLQGELLGAGGSTAVAASAAASRTPSRGLLSTTFRICALVLGLCTPILIVQSSMFQSILGSARSGDSAHSFSAIASGANVVSRPLPRHSPEVVSELEAAMSLRGYDARNKSSHRFSTANVRHAPDPVAIAESTSLASQPVGDASPVKLRKIRAHVQFNQSQHAGTANTADTKREDETVPRSQNAIAARDGGHRVYGPVPWSKDVPHWFKPPRNVTLRIPQVFPENEAHLGRLDAGDCVRIQGQIYCLPVLVCIGMKKAGSGEIQRWLVKHPNLTAGFFHPAHMNGIGEVQYFNNLERRGICDNCWSSALNGPTDELLFKCVVLFEQRVSNLPQSVLVGLQRISVSTGFEYVLDLHVRIGRYLTMEDRNAPLFKMRREADVGHIHQTEKTPGYWERADPRDLHSVMPSVRLVVLFRKPSSMVYSRYWYCRSLRHYDKCGGPNFDDFLRQAFIDDAYEALSDEQKVSQGHLHPPIYNQLYPWKTPTTLISPQNFFTETLDNWFKVFEPEQLLIWFAEDFMKDPFSFISAVQAHAGLPPFDYRGELGFLLAGDLLHKNMACFSHPRPRCAVPFRMNMLRGNQQSRSKMKRGCSQ
eukprot:INCI16341.6.p1 GENE.INCI16341.6~~INCI16341.6.p1  ORF type:complete len:608 (+),score=67.51 INCI16341.6:239-2062(+)